MLNYNTKEREIDLNISYQVIFINKEFLYFDIIQYKIKLNKFKDYYSVF